MKKIIRRLVIVDCFVLTVAFFYAFSFYSWHWHGIFRPAVFQFITGNSPYSVEGFFNPPWALIPLVPFALLPPRLGSAFVSAVTIWSIVLVAMRQGAKALALLMVILAPSSLIIYTQVNVDFLPLLGLLMPPWIGLFFVLSKPQVGIGIAIYWFIVSYRENGLWKTAKTFSPVIAALIASFLVYGLWPLTAADLPDIWWNLSLWPYALPVAAAMIVYAIRSKRAGVAFASSPLLSPYMGSSSWSIAAIGLLPSGIITVAVIAVTWLYVIVVPYPPILDIGQHISELLFDMNLVAMK